MGPLSLVVVSSALELVVETLLDAKSGGGVVIFVLLAVPVLGL